MNEKTKWSILEEFPKPTGHIKGHIVVYKISKRQEVMWLVSHGVDSLKHEPYDGRGRLLDKRWPLYPYGIDFSSYK